MVRVGRERVNCHHQIFSLFYSLAKEDSSTFTQYTTAVFKLIQCKKDLKKENPMKSISTTSSL